MLHHLRFEGTVSVVSNGYILHPRFNKIARGNISQNSSMAREPVRKQRALGQMLTLALSEWLTYSSVSVGAVHVHFACTSLLRTFSETGLFPAQGVGGGWDPHSIWGSKWPSSLEAKPLHMFSVNSVRRV